jgi:hypothetical protein
MDGNRQSRSSVGVKNNSCRLFYSCKKVHSSLPMLLPQSTFMVRVEIGVVYLPSAPQLCT